VFTPGMGTETLTLILLVDGTLQVQTDVHFTDGSSRADFSVVGWFTR
jgi:hypothetical protein